MTVSNDRDHDARIAQIQRVLDRLEQVTKQANDLQRMARELEQEAGESMRLLKDSESPPAAARKRPRIRGRARTRIR
jgi:hypothetical protein